jgi:hypothetical protein
MKVTHIFRSHLATMIVGASLVAVGLSSVGCKDKAAPAKQSTVAVGSNDVATATTPAAPVEMAPAKGSAAGLESALAAWNKGSPDTVGLSVKALVDWSKQDGALPPLPAKPIDAVSARFAYFKMASALVATRVEDPSVVEATLYLAQRMRQEGATLQEVTLGGQLADQVTSLAKVPPAFAAKYAPVDAEFIRAFAVEGKHLQDLTAWMQTEDGKQTAAAAAASGSGSAAIMVPTTAQMQEAVGLFAAINDKPPADKAGFLTHLKAKVEPSTKSSNKITSDTAKVLPSHADRLFGYVTGYQAWLRGDLAPASGAIPTPGVAAPVAGH